MSKNYTMSSMGDILLRIKIPASKTVDTSQGGEVTHKTEHYAALLKCTAKAKNGIASAPIVLEDIYLGTAKDVPWTAHQIWEAVKNADLNTIFADALKDLYQSGINEDITT